MIKINYGDKLKENACIFVYNDVQSKILLVRSIKINIFLSFIKGELLYSKIHRRVENIERDLFLKKENYILYVFEIFILDV